MLAICSTAIFGQKVSDYKYVSIPENFVSFKGESYGLEAVLAKALKARKYVVLPSNKSQWPEEAMGLCNVVNADVISVKSLLTNKLILEFRDCSNKVLLESKGNSYIKEYEEGLADALKIALVNVGVSNPVEMSPAPAQTQVQTSEPVASSPVQSSVQNPVVEKTAVASASGNYSNGKVNVQKIQIDANQFILAKSGSSVPFAIFKTTSKKDVFIVKLADNNTTVGYFENGNIIIDIPQADGRYTKEIFTGK